MAFKYERRTEEDWEKRTQGTGYEGFVLDEFPVLKMRKGDNRIRIYPPTWERAAHYGYDVFVHFGVGPDKASVICLQKMRNEPCPVCEERVRTQRAGDEDEAKLMAPRHRVVCWAEDKKDDKRTVAVWNCAKTLDTDISKRCKDRETGKIKDIDDPDAGHDVFFDTEGDGARTKYVAVEISDKTNRVSDKNLNYVIDHPIPSVLRWRTYEEVLALFEGAPKSDRRDDLRGRDDDRRSSRDRDRDDDYRRRDRDDDRDSRSARRREDDEPRRSRDEDDRPRRTRDEDYRSSRRDDDRPRDEDYRSSRRDDDDREVRRERDSRRGRDADDEIPFEGRRGERETRSDDPAPTKTNGAAANDEPARSTRPTLNRRDRPDEDHSERTRERDRDDPRSDPVRGKDRAKELSQRFEKRE